MNPKMDCLVLKFLSEHGESNKMIGNRIRKFFQCSETSIWQNGHKVVKNAKIVQKLAFFVISGSAVAAVAILGRTSWLLRQGKRPGQGGAMWDDFWVGPIKFSVTRAFQQDQTVLLGKNVDVKSFL